MTMTTTRSHPTSKKQSETPQIRWRRIVAVVAALIVALIVVVLTQSESGQGQDLTSGFDYNDDATPARIVTEEPVSGQYFGHSDVLWPVKDLTSGFDLGDDTSPGFGRNDEPIARLYLGYNLALNPDP